MSMLSRPPQSTARAQLPTQAFCITIDDRSFENEKPTARGEGTRTQSKRSAASPSLRTTSIATGAVARRSRSRGHHDCTRRAHTRSSSAGRRDQPGRPRPGVRTFLRLSVLVLEVKPKASPASSRSSAPCARLRAATTCDAVSAGMRSSRRRRRGRGPLPRSDGRTASARGARGRRRGARPSRARG
jgi:hypothetical protein